MKHVRCADGELVTGNPQPRAIADFAEVGSFDREFLRAHGRPRGPICVLTREHCIQIQSNSKSTIAVDTSSPVGC